MLITVLPDSKSPIYFASFCFMLDSLSFGLVMPVMPDLLVALGCDSISEAAYYAGLLSAVFAVFQFVCGPTIGNLSDRFGRKPVFLASLLVLFVDSAIKGLTHSIWILFAGRILCGISQANYSIASAIIADRSNTKDRAANFGLLGTALGLGFILGAFFGGFLSEFGFRAPLYVAAIISIGNLVIGFLFVEESLDSKKMRPFTWTRANPLGAFKELRAFPGLMRLMLVVFFYEIAFGVYQATWAYFTKEKFGWDASAIGVSLGLFGIMAIAMQGIAIRFFLRRWSEYKTALFALFVTAVAFSILAFASHSWMIFALLPLSALGTIFLPAVQSLLTRFVKEDSQGELQGAVTSVRALSLMIGPPLMTGAFSLFTAIDASVFFPGAAFLLAMIISAFSIVIFIGAQHSDKSA